VVATLVPHLEDHHFTGRVPHSTVFRTLPRSRFDRILFAGWRDSTGLPAMGCLSVVVDNLAGGLPLPEKSKTVIPVEGDIRDRVRLQEVCQRYLHRLVAGSAYRAGRRGIGDPG
jgi:hypothetical protein